MLNRQSGKRTYGSTYPLPPIHQQQNIKQQTLEQKIAYQQQIVDKQQTKNLDETMLNTSSLDFNNLSNEFQQQYIPTVQQNSHNQIQNRHIQPAQHDNDKIYSEEQKSTHPPFYQKNHEQNPEKSVGYEFPELLGSNLVLKNDTGTKQSLQELQNDLKKRQWQDLTRRIDLQEADFLNLSNLGKDADYYYPNQFDEMASELMDDQLAKSRQQLGQIENQYLERQNIYHQQFFQQELISQEKFVKKYLDMNSLESLESFDFNLEDPKVDQSDLEILQLINQLSQNHYEDQPAQMYHSMIEINQNNLNQLAQAEQQFKDDQNQDQSLLASLDFEISKSVINADHHQIKQLNEKKSKIINKQNDFQFQPYKQPIKSDIVPPYFFGCDLNTFKLQYRHFDQNYAQFKETSKFQKFQCIKLNSLIDVLQRLFQKIIDQDQNIQDNEIIKNDMKSFIRLIDFIENTITQINIELLQTFYLDVQYKLIIVSKFKFFNQAMNDMISQVKQKGIIQIVDYKIRFNIPFQEQIWQQQEYFITEEDDIKYNQIHIQKQQNFFQVYKQYLQSTKQEEQEPISVKIQKRACIINSDKNKDFIFISEQINRYVDSIQQQYLKELTGEGNEVLNYKMKSVPLIVHVSNLLNDLQLIEQCVYIIINNPIYLMDVLIDLITKGSNTTVAIIIGSLNPEYEILDIMCQYNPLVINAIKQKVDENKKYATSFCNLLGLIYDTGCVLLEGLSHRFYCIDEKTSDSLDLQRLKLEAAEIFLRQSIKFSKCGEVKIFDNDSLFSKFQALHEQNFIPFCDNQLGIIMSGVINQSMKTVNQQLDIFYQKIFCGLLVQLGIVQTNDDSIFFYKFQCDQDMFQLKQRLGLDKGVVFNDFLMQNIDVDISGHLLQQRQYSACMGSSLTLLGQFFLIYLDISTRFERNNEVHGKKEATHQLTTQDFFESLISNDQKIVETAFQDLQKKIFSIKQNDMIDALKEQIKKGSIYKAGRNIFCITVLSDLQTHIQKQKNLIGINFMVKYEKILQNQLIRNDQSIREIVELNRQVRTAFGSQQYLANSIQPQGYNKDKKADYSTVKDAATNYINQTQEFMDRPIIFQDKKPPQYRKNLRGDFILVEQQQSDEGETYYNRLLFIKEQIQDNLKVIQQMKQIVSECINNNLRTIERNDKIFAFQNFSWTISTEISSRLSQSYTYQRVNEQMNNPLNTILPNMFDLQEYRPETIDVLKKIFRSDLDYNQINISKKTSQIINDNLVQTIKKMDENSDIFHRQLEVLLQNSYKGQLYESSKEMLKFIQQNESKIFVQKSPISLKLVKFVVDYNQQDSKMLQGLGDHIIKYQEDYEKQYLNILGYDMRKINEKKDEEKMDIVDTINMMAQFDYKNPQDLVKEILGTHQELYQNKREQLSREVDSINTISYFTKGSGIFMGISLGYALGLHNIFQYYQEGQFKIRTFADFHRESRQSVKDLYLSIVYGTQKVISDTLGQDRSILGYHWLNTPKELQNKLNVAKPFFQLMLQDTPNYIDGLLYFASQLYTKEFPELQTYALVQGSVFNIETGYIQKRQQTIISALTNYGSEYKVQEQYTSKKFYDDKSALQTLRIFYDTALFYGEGGIRFNQLDIMTSTKIILKTQYDFLQQQLKLFEYKDTSTLNKQLLVEKQYLEEILIPDIKQALDDFSHDSPAAIANAIFTPQPRSDYLLEIINQFKETQQENQPIAEMTSVKEKMDISSQNGFVCYSLGLNNPDNLLRQYNDTLPLDEKDLQTLYKLKTEVQNFCQNHVHQHFGQRLLFDRYGTMNSYILGNQKFDDYEEKFKNYNLQGQELQFRYLKEVDQEYAENPHFTSGIKANIYGKRDSDLFVQEMLENPPDIYQRQISYNTVIQKCVDSTNNANTVKGDKCKEIVYHLIDTPLKDGEYQKFIENIGQYDQELLSFQQGKQKIKSINQITVSNVYQTVVHGVKNYISPSPENKYQDNSFPLRDQYHQATMVHINEKQKFMNTQMLLREEDFVDTRHNDLLSRANSILSTYKIYPQLNSIQDDGIVPDLLLYGVMGLTSFYLYFYASKNIAQNVLYKKIIKNLKNKDVGIEEFKEYQNDQIVSNQIIEKDQQITTENLERQRQYIQFIKDQGQNCFLNQKTILQGIFQLIQNQGINFLAAFTFDKIIDQMKLKRKNYNEIQNSYDFLNPVFNDFYKTSPSKEFFNGLAIKVQQLQFNGPDQINHFINKIPSGLRSFSGDDFKFLYDQASYENIVSGILLSQTGYKGLLEGINVYKSLQESLSKVKFQHNSNESMNEQNYPMDQQLNEKSKQLVVYLDYLNQKDNYLPQDVKIAQIDEAQQQLALELRKKQVKQDQQAIDNYRNISNKQFISSIQKKAQDFFEKESQSSLPINLKFDQQKHSIEPFFPMLDQYISKDNYEQTLQKMIMSMHDFVASGRKKKGTSVIDRLQEPQKKIQWQQLVDQQSEKGLQQSVEEVMQDIQQDYKENGDQLSLLQKIQQLWKYYRKNPQIQQDSVENDIQEFHNRKRVQIQDSVENDIQEFHNRKRVQIQDSAQNDFQERRQRIIAEEIKEDQNNQILINAEQLNLGQNDRPVIQQIQNQDISNDVQKKLIFEAQKYAVNKMEEDFYEGEGEENESKLGPALYEIGQFLFPENFKNFGRNEYRTNVYKQYIQQYFKNQNIKSQDLLQKAIDQDLDVSKRDQIFTQISNFGGRSIFHKEIDQETLKLQETQRLEQQRKNVGDANSEMLQKIEKKNKEIEERIRIYLIRKEAEQIFEAQKYAVNKMEEDFYKREGEEKESKLGPALYEIGQFLFPENFKNFGRNEYRTNVYKQYIQQYFKNQNIKSQDLLQKAIDQDLDVSKRDQIFTQISNFGGRSIYHEENEKKNKEFQDDNENKYKQIRDRKQIGDRKQIDLIKKQIEQLQQQQVQQKQVQQQQPVTDQQIFQQQNQQNSQQFYEEYSFKKYLKQYEIPNQQYKQPAVKNNRQEQTPIYQQIEQKLQQPLQQQVNNQVQQKAQQQDIIYKEKQDQSLFEIANQLQKENFQQNNDDFQMLEQIPIKYQQVVQLEPEVKQSIDFDHDLQIMMGIQNQNFADYFPDDHSMINQLQVVSQNIQQNIKHQPVPIIEKVKKFLSSALNIVQPQKNHQGINLNPLVQDDDIQMDQQDYDQKPKDKLENQLSDLFNLGLEEVKFDSEHKKKIISEIKEVVQEEIKEHQQQLEEDYQMDEDFERQNQIQINRQRIENLHLERDQYDLGVFDNFFIEDQYQQAILNNLQNQEENNILQIHRSGRVDHRQNAQRNFEQREEIQNRIDLVRQIPQQYLNLPQDQLFLNPEVFVPQQLREEYLMGQNARYQQKEIQMGLFAQLFNIKNKVNELLFQKYLSFDYAGKQLLSDVEGKKKRRKRDSKEEGKKLSKKQLNDIIKSSIQNIWQ